ncbi:hypothetical protein M9Y10_029603 [Tritrichomonas musculus]|uniref:Protein kinase domain-containing protein n=1 Tax=Tritrichomonas musculus TaxID=1915356 RepID=A0ABR2KN97_9EUKA
MDYASSLSKSLNKKLKIIEALTDQTAVHRKKFEFALSQIKKFTKKYTKLAKKNQKLTTEKKNAALSIIQNLNELQEIMGDYLLETWTNSTIDNSSNSVLNILQELFSDLKSKSLIISPKCSKYIIPDSPEWNQYHMLDLRAIEASFTQYLNIKSNDASKPTPESTEIIDKMNQRLSSINREITISNGESISPSSPTKFSVSRSFSPIPVNYRKWLVDINDFDFQDPIGSGVSATVYRGIYKKTGEEVAIKEFKWIKMNGSRLQSFQREVAVLATVNHPTLLKLIGATDTPPFCIITEWMPNGSLFSALHEQALVDPTLKMIAAFDIARGMQYLHAHHIVHRDLKSLNVLMDKDMRVRICDFAFSRHATNEQTMTSNIGTPHWMAPEILFSNQNYTSKVDVYAFGVLLWELVTSQIPYNGVPGRSIMYEVRDLDIRPALPSSEFINPSFRDLITQCWDRNPDIRPSFDEIVRRFIDEKIRIDGTDDRVFDEYIRTSSTNSEIVNKKVKEVFERAVKKKEISLGAAVRKIRKLGGVPAELIDKLWQPEVISPLFARKKSDIGADEDEKVKSKVNKGGEYDSDDDDDKSEDDDDDDKDELNNQNENSEQVAKSETTEKDGINNENRKDSSINCNTADVNNSNNENNNINSDSSSNSNENTNNNSNCNCNNVNNNENNCINSEISNNKNTNNNSNSSDDTNNNNSNSSDNNATSENSSVNNNENNNINNDIGSNGNANNSCNGIVHDEDRSSVDAKTSVSADGSPGESARGLVVSDEDASQYLLLFNKTSKLGEVAKVLRSMKNGSIPRDVMCEFISEVPTGSNEVDADIVVAACKNGCADFASLYASRDVDISLALLVCARSGVDVTLRAAVTDLCVICLTACKLDTSASNNETSNSSSLLSSNTDRNTLLNENANSNSLLNENANSNSLLNENANSNSLLNENANSNSLLNENANSNSLLNENANSNSLLNENANSNSLLNENANSNSLLNENANSNSLLNENANSNSLLNENANSNSLLNENANSNSLLNENANSNSLLNEGADSKLIHYDHVNNEAKDESHNDVENDANHSNSNSEKHLNLNAHSKHSSTSNTLSSADSFISSSTLVSSSMELVNESNAASMKFAAALLCLVGIGKLNRIAQLIQNSNTNFMIRFLRSQDKSLKNAALVASVALANEGSIFNVSNRKKRVKCEVKNNQNDNDNLLFDDSGDCLNSESEVDKLFDVLLNMIQDEPLAASAIVNIVSKEKYYAEKLISKIEKNSDYIHENTLKALIASAKIRELRSKIKSILEKNNPKDEMKVYVQRFLSLI